MPRAKSFVPAYDRPHLHLTLSVVNSLAPEFLTSPFRDFPLISNRRPQVSTEGCTLVSASSTTPSSQQTPHVLGSYPSPPPPALPGPFIHLTPRLSTAYPQNPLLPLRNLRPSLPLQDKQPPHHRVASPRHPPGISQTPSRPPLILLPGPNISPLQAPLRRLPP